MKSLHSTQDDQNSAHEQRGSRLGSPRAWAALAILVAAYFLTRPVEDMIFFPILHVGGLHVIENETMTLVPYGIRMVVRLLWNAALVLAICTALGRSVLGFPLRERHLIGRLVLGWIIGLVVMIAAILGIVAAGGATVASTHQPLSSAVLHGVGWLGFDLLGSAGEELLGRAAVLLVAESLIGRKGAVLMSGLLFAGDHLGNPGASNVWLLRLFLQGALLAYAVYRTGSLWWGIGYHAGWNWASAPLFGAAGSGYLDEGHLLDFTPRGSPWITGGSVGPEGSLFAFVAVLAAFGLLVLTTDRRSQIAEPAVAV